MLFNASRFFWRAAGVAKSGFLSVSVMPAVLGLEEELDPAQEHGMRRTEGGGELDVVGALPQHLEAAHLAAAVDAAASDPVA